MPAHLRTMLAYSVAIALVASACGDRRAATDTALLSPPETSAVDLSSSSSPTAAAVTDRPAAAHTAPPLPSGSRPVDVSASRSPIAATVRLLSDRPAYAAREGMLLTARNESDAQVELGGSLGQLRGWRIDASGRVPWDHGLVELQVLVAIPPGSAKEIGPVAAPDRVGRYLLEISYIDSGGARRTAGTEIDVVAAVSPSAPRSVSAAPSQPPAQGSPPTPRPEPTSTSRSAPALLVLRADRSSYSPRDPMRLSASNVGAQPAQLRSSLGGLQGWRLTDAGREVWDHGILETQALVDVPPGAKVEFGAIAAPERTGRYLLRITFMDAAGSASTAETEIEVR